jgi:hypothetical protein
MNHPQETLHIESSKNIQMDRKKFQKMVFITNALEDGWTVKKSQDSYIFTKKHENLREIFQENYLENFIIDNVKGGIYSLTSSD